MEWRGQGPGDENTGTQGHKERVKNSDRDMGRDRKKRRDRKIVTGVGTQGKGPREPKEALRYSRKGTGTETQGHRDNNRDKIIY